MSDTPDSRPQLELGAAVLVTCVVQTLADSDRSFQQRFVKRLDEAYARLRDDPKVSLRALEDLSWCRELLTGFSVATGQGRPFLG